MKSIKKQQQKTTTKNNNKKQQQKKQQQQSLFTQDFSYSFYSHWTFMKDKKNGMSSYFYKARFQAMCINRCKKLLLKRNKQNKMNEIDLSLYIIITWLEQVFLDIKKVKNKNGMNWHNNEKLCSLLLKTDLQWDWNVSVSDKLLMLTTFSTYTIQGASPTNVKTFPPPSPKEEKYCFCLPT